MKTMKITLAPLAASLWLGYALAFGGDTPSPAQTNATNQPVAATATGQSRFAGGQWRSGQTLFQENCASCHGANLKGGMMGAPSLLGVTRRMSDQAIVAHARKIGATMCCAHGILSLSDAQFGDIVAFLHAVDSDAAVSRQVAQLKSSGGCGCSMMAH